MMLNAETGLRGYNLYNDAVFLEPYEQAIQELPETLLRLKELVRNDPTQSARAAEMEAKVLAILAWEADTKKLLIEDHNSRKRPLPEQRGREEKRRMDEFRSEMTEFLAAEETIENKRDNELAQARAWLYGVLLIGGLAAIALTVALGLLFRRQINRRFALLTANTHRLAEGKELTPPLGGMDEIAELDTMFRQMAASLREAAQRDATTLKRSSVTSASVPPD